ncbi:oxygen-dependent coproporphyrinogen oxidase [Candidatus Liberibacter americanus]|uniref:coproporphyrinogen oxidase n=1 Tax=Candidatus Liberibacter americanus str. Sao Paulo TaxID=1261131 RepID=U6B563_9HYPH|nr:oxygen-dependent coproporphyrinogen oxidase [Candidatus Liberibacter americanus]AHA28050.1 Coproporphyrinogen III oxidase [Candidatus Liberibacter americanus str. Sao Paulo]EMS35980.1 coproporphyrinogen III oxidase [Candidatus Liberibacter americanus PW_SP]
MNFYDIEAGFPSNIDKKKEEAENKFKKLQSLICSEFEILEIECSKYYPSKVQAGSFKFKKWLRDKTKATDLGGGHMATLSGGRVFEKAAVLVSTVYGELSPDFRDQVPGTSKSPDFWATGISVIAHPYNPYVPTIHMNIRMMTTNSYWFGGGIDLTPFLKSRRKLDDPDVLLFHDHLKKLCNLHKVSDYELYKNWCNQYFFLPHRQETRGVGGIFFDYLHSNEKEGGIDADFAFASSVGDCFLKIYPLLVRRNYNISFSEKDRQEQLLGRGRYVEFNLLYDRGTSFGLKTGGNTDSILSSMPPMVSWE